MKSFNIKNRVKQRPLLYITYSALLILIILNFEWILNAINDFLGVLTPFFLSIAIAYIMHPLAQTVQKGLDKIYKFKINKGIAIAIVYIALISAIGVGTTFLIPELYKSIMEIFHKLPSYLEEIKKFLETFNIDTSGLTMSRLEELITEEASNIQEYLPKAINTATSIVGGIVNTIIGIVFSLYILADKDRIFAYCKKASIAMFGERKTKKISKNIAECSTNINKYLAGSIIDSIIIGFVVFIILTIFKMPYALLVGCLIGLTNIIPNFGPIIGATPATLLYLSIDIKMALTFLIIILIIQQIDGNIIVPKIIGTKLGIRPLVILPAILIGGHYFGPVGMVLGTPILSMLNLYFCRWMDRKIHERKKAAAKQAAQSTEGQTNDDGTIITISDD